MVEERLIAEKQLATLWGLHWHTLIRWRNGGLIDSDVKRDAEHGYHHLYYLSNIEKYHREHATGFEDGMALPTVSELLASDRGLLTPEEAGRLLGCDTDTTLRLIRKGELPTIKLHGDRSFRLPAALVRIIAHSDGGYVDTDTAARVLCIQESSIRTLRKSGYLEGRSLRGQGTKIQVERKSLLELLAKLVSPLYTPEVWWEKMLMDDGDPLTKDQIIAKYNVHKRTLNQLIAKNSPSLPYIRTTGKTPRTLVPAWGIRIFLREERERLTLDQLDVLLGVRGAQAESLYPPKGMCRRWHGQAWNRCPSLRCVREYITANRTHPSIDSDAWITDTMQRGVRPLSSHELLDTTPFLEPHNIEEAVADGRLRGVRLPDWQRKPAFSITLPDAIGFRRAWERSL